MTSWKSQKLIPSKKNLFFQKSQKLVPTKHQRITHSQNLVLPGMVYWMTAKFHFKLLCLVSERGGKEAWFDPHFVLEWKIWKQTLQEVECVAPTWLPPNFPPPPPAPPHCSLIGDSCITWCLFYHFSPFMSPFCGPFPHTQIKPTCG